MAHHSNETVNHLFVVLYHSKEISSCSMLTCHFLYCMQFQVAPSSGWAGLQLFTLATQTRNKHEKTYKDNSSSCFDNLLQ